MKSFKIEKLYIYIFLIFGLLFVFLIPPFQAPDEDSHFKRSYSISNLDIYPVNKNKTAGNYFPKEMLKYIDNQLQYIGDRNKKFTYSNFVEEQVKKINYEDKKFNNYSTTMVLPIVYIAPSIGIIFSKIIAIGLGMDSVSTTYMLYFARIFSLLAIMVITYHAIKITPVMKKTMFTLSLLPMTLFLSSVVTYDNILIALTFLSTAKILNLIFNKEKEKISKLDVIILSIIGFILLNVKVFYFFSYVLMFFIPKEKYGNGSLKSLMKTWLFAVLLILLLTFLFKLPILLGNFASSNVQFNKQLNFILNNPFKYLNILFFNILDSRYFQLNGIIGLFGLVDTYLPIALVSIYVLYLIIFTFCDGNNTKINFNFKMKLCLSLYIIFSIIGIYTIMYLDWTPKILKEIGGNIITGVQGRYFIPLLFPLSLLFINRFLKLNKISRILLNNYFIFPVIMLAISLFTIIFRFWC